MSYIRCLSNPEGLYVFGSGKVTEFYRQDKFNFMPSKVFDKLLDKYVAQEAEPGSTELDAQYKHEGALLEIHADNYEDTKKKPNYKWYLSYKGEGNVWGEPIEMWEVTLDFIAQYAYEKQRAGFLIEELKEKGFEEAAKVLEERYED